MNSYFLPLSLPAIKKYKVTKLGNLICGKKKRSRPLGS